jgi:hypothetical protein
MFVLKVSKLINVSNMIVLTQKKKNKIKLYKPGSRRNNRMDRKEFIFSLVV